MRWFFPFRLACLVLSVSQLHALEPVFPGKSWESKSPQETELNLTKLEEAARLMGGRGCVVRFGYMVFTWGDATKSADIASASKVFYSHLLFEAIEQGRLENVDVPVVQFQPCLHDLNSALAYKDRTMTFRHLANQTACLGFADLPGTAFDYNDATMGFFWDTLVNKVYRVPWNEADEKIFRPNLSDTLQFQDRFTVRTGNMGRPVISPRDFARFGLFYLNRGRWGQDQVVAEKYVRLAWGDPLPLTIGRTRAEPADKCAARSIGGGANQTDHNGGYSWLWWLNARARDGRSWWPQAPPEWIAALGHCGQRGLAILPQQQLIVSWNDAKEIHCDRELGSRVFQTLADAAR